MLNDLRDQRLDGHDQEIDELKEQTAILREQQAQIIKNQTGFEERVGLHDQFLNGILQPSGQSAPRSPRSPKATSPANAIFSPASRSGANALTPAAPTPASRRASLAMSLPKSPLIVSPMIASFTVQMAQEMCAASLTMATCTAQPLMLARGLSLPNVPRPFTTHAGAHLQWPHAHPCASPAS